MNSEKIFADRVKILRTQLNLTQQQLGEAIGLSKQAVNDIEQGRRQTTITKAIQMARLFNTTIEYLTGDSDDPVRPNELPLIEHLFGHENTFRFSSRLKQLREEKKLTPQKIGKDTHFGTLRYKNLETSTTIPNIDTLIALADYFDVSLDYLVGRSDDPKRR